MTIPCTVLRLGLVDYLEAWELQKRLAREVGEGRSAGWLLLLEHPPTYTLGVRAREEHLLLAQESFGRLGAKVYRVDRGGDVTYHGPGQLVGYPILNLKRWGGGPLWYVRTLESALIDALAALGVEAARVEGHTGVWVGNEKIAAIGVHVSRGVTTHGFALNVDPDLAYFRHIVPCGLVDAGVTSLRRVLGRRVHMGDRVLIKPSGPFVVRQAHHERNLRTARPEPVEGRAATFSAACVDEAAHAVVSAFAGRFGLSMVEAEPGRVLAGAPS